MTEIIQLLLDCLKKGCPVDGDRLAVLAPESWHALLALAASQRLRPLLWHRLKQKELAELLPDEIAAELREAFRRNTMRNLNRYGELRCLLTTLQADGIPLVLLKGIYLANTVYENIGLREMSDIDVLARPADLERIVAILTGMGYASPQPLSLEAAMATSPHLPPMIKSRQLKFEIHWNLTEAAAHYSIDPSGLWERAVRVRIAGGEALAFSPEDLLLHLCMHTAYQHQFVFDLRPFCDITATIDHFSVRLDWLTVMERAESWGWRRGIYLALRLARDLVGAEVPIAVLERLMPADMTTTVLDTAIAQVFSDKSTATPVPESFASLLESSCLADKIRIFWQRLFLPKAMIAALYAVPADSVRIYGCYPRRFVYLVRRYSHTLKKYQFNDDGKLHAMVARQNRISTWLAGSAEDCCPSAR